MLVNLQPHTSDMPLEACVADERRSIGIATDSPEMRENMHSALAAIDGAVEACLFRFVDSAEWVFTFVLESDDDWEEFLASTGCGGADADPVVVAAALAEPDGRIVVTEQDVAQVLVRV